MAHPALKLDHYPRNPGATHPYSGAPVSPLTTSGGRGWHNRLPAWIVDCPAFMPYRQGVKRTLQAVANACDSPDSDLNLIGAFGGQRLIQESGCSDTTFWRHIRQLEHDGFVVVLARGGNIGKRNAGNVYGVPGEPGSLDGRRCRRRVQVMSPDHTGTYKPQVLQPGDQPTLWHQTAKPISGPDTRRRSNTHNVRTQDAGHHTSVSPSYPQNGALTGGGRVTLTRGVVSKRHTTISYTHPLVKNHAQKRHRVNGHVGALRVSAGGTQANRVGVLKNQNRVTPHARWCLSTRDLQDARTLSDRFGQSVVRGWVNDTERDRINFYCAACHAVRVADNPPAMFTAMVKKSRAGGWLYITDEDEQRALAMLKPACKEKRMGNDWEDEVFGYDH